MTNPIKQFILDVARGVLVGAIVWYIIRPKEPIFSRFEGSVDDGKDMLESLIRLLADSPPEQLMMACGAGFVLGFTVWISRKPSKKMKVK